MTTAAIYVRQSLDPTGEEAAVLRQRAECEALCAERGWDVAEVYSDNDKSASNGKPRPNYQRLFREIGTGRFSVIVAWHPDRLHRRPRELEDFIDLIEAHKIKVETVRAGHWDLSTPSGRVVARTLGAIARFEVEQKSDRQKAGNRQRALAGAPHSSPNPFGYRREALTEDGKVKGATLAVVPREAEALRRGYELLLSGGTLYGIAADWNAAGLRTSANRPWTGHTVRRRLVQPVYAGFVVYDGEHLGSGNWEPLVEEDTWRSAIALLSDPERRTSTDYARRYMLSGLALCGVEGCTGKVSTGRSHRGKRTYVCIAKHLARAAEPVDELITTLVLERLSRDDARKLLHDDSTSDTTALRDKAQALRVRADDLVVMFSDGSMSRRQFELANAKLTAELQRLESQLAYTHRTDVLSEIVGKDVAQVWQRLSVDRRRAIVGELMTVTLTPPGRGKMTLDPTTVHVTWR